MQTLPLEVDLPSCPDLRLQTCADTVPGPDLFVLSDRWLAGGKQW
jgi:hypothetical protein